MKVFKPEDFKLLDKTAPSLRTERAAIIANEKLEKDVELIRRIAAEHSVESFQGGVEAEKKQSLDEFLVDRFLTWPLPRSVCSDQCCCVSDYPNRVGTNLLTADEARQMIRYLFGSLPMGNRT